MVNLQHIYEVFATCIPYIALQVLFQLDEGIADPPNHWNRSRGHLVAEEIFMVPNL